MNVENRTDTVFSFMLAKYCGSLLLILVLVCAALSRLRFATLSQVRAGNAIDETWTCEFTLDLAGNRFYRINEAARANLEKGIAFVGSGVVHVRSADIQITPKRVSWQEGRTGYSATGGRMVAKVTWETSSDAPSGAKGDIHVEFPKVPGVRSYTLSIRTGSVQKTGDGRWVFREVTAYRSANAAALGRFRLVLGTGFPIAVVLQTIWWGFQLRKQKRVGIAALIPTNPQSLPRTFYASPIAEWTIWTVILGFFGVIGCIFSGNVIYNGFVSSSLDRVMLVVEGIGITGAAIAAWAVRRSAVTVRVDAHSISYARGRGQPQWITAKWSRLSGATVGSRTYKGNTTEWVEVTFPDGKQCKIPSTTVDYAILRDIVLERYARQGRGG